VSLTIYFSSYSLVNNGFFSFFDLYICVVNQLKHGRMEFGRNIFFATPE